MIASLRSNEIDIGIGLTEGWIAGLAGKQAVDDLGGRDGGYKIVGQWVDTPLRWAIVTGQDRSDIQGLDDLKGKRVGISRLGRCVWLMVVFILAPCD
jgi:ABC-type nitrate/sulfonate/bicarbonate transport system substrate-binding protein